MKIPLIDSKNAEVAKRELPPQFGEEVRTDLIKRAVLAIASNNRQPYGTDPRAGMRASAKLSRRRRDYKGSYGIGISRVPRKIMSRRGTRMNWVAAEAPGMRKGRRAHPPKASKIWSQSLNTKERRKAIRSALAATVSRDIVVKRGHKAPENYPFMIESNVETVKKTKDAIALFRAIGLTEELARVSTRHVRAGKGTMRGRRYKQSRGPLFVVSAKCALQQAARNIPGVEIVEVDSLNAELLAPGIKAGRVTIFTDAALQRLAKEMLFMDKRPKVKDGSA